MSSNKSICSKYAESTTKSSGSIAGSEISGGVESSTGGDVGVVAGVGKTAVLSIFPVA